MSIILGLRYWRIVFFFARVTLGIIFWDIFLRRIGLGALVRATRPRRLRQVAVPLSCAGDPPRRGDDQGGAVPLRAAGCVAA
ncbi:MAG: hypothetical protein HND47_15035 [Chloroflexi bacterium]|nr:hypothetical protein [Chloroflexota bacterium]